MIEQRVSSGLPCLAVDDDSLQKGADRGEPKTPRDRRKQAPFHVIQCKQRVRPGATPALRGSREKLPINRRLVQEVGCAQAGGSSPRPDFANRATGWRRFWRPLKWRRPRRTLLTRAPAGACVLGWRDQPNISGLDHSDLLGGAASRGKGQGQQSGANQRRGKRLRNRIPERLRSG